ncbi:hypothetical protein FN846DRAFT_904563 [Sphaerosporella brunnea]|uniref:Uncharacterized protein n=1 Tax=Sphaerosporella brunnea TaxID=1250544 RepID=A0A5J5F3X9_9PEZI|nr:hypothetical protein FN846DRAFT_904563 [Sphaerosporella brunnea]
MAAGLWISGGAEVLGTALVVLSTPPFLFGIDNWFYSTKRTSHLPQCVGKRKS